MLFSYGGYQHGTYIAGRAKNPKRTIPWGILIGVAIVVACYVGINAAYLNLLGQEGMAASDALAADAAGSALGPIAQKIVAGAIIISAGGVMNTICLAFPYVTTAMSKDGLFFAPAAKLHPRFGTPVFAIAIQGVWGCAATWVGSDRIDILLSGIAFGEWTFFALVVVALFLLRRSLPKDESAYRAPSWVAITFGACAVFVTIGAAFLKPMESGIGVIVLVIGTFIYILRLWTS